MLAISSGSTVALWDFKLDNRGKSFRPFSSNPVCDLCWSSDGSKLALASSSADVEQANIVITTFNEQNDNNEERLAFHSSCSLLSDSPPFAYLSRASSLSFEGSRYLCCGMGHVISVFDLKKRGKVRSLDLPIGSLIQQQNFRSKACISQSVVAAVSNHDAALYLYNLKGNHTEPTILRGTTGLNDDQQVGCSALCLSQHVATGMTNGAISIWDVQCEATACSIFSQVDNPISDMCFSPVNSRLLASCQHDSILFHDASSSNSIATMSIGAECTSLSLSGDGVSCAVGSVGTVLIYDLRKSSSPVTQWDAKHTDPVTCVRFQPRRTTSASCTKPRDSININADTGNNSLNQLTEDEATSEQPDTTNEYDRTADSRIVYELPNEYEDTSFLLSLSRNGSLPGTERKTTKITCNDENHESLLSSRVVDNIKPKSCDATLQNKVRCDTLILCSIV